MNFHRNGVLPFPQNAGDIELNGEVRRFIAVRRQSIRIDRPIRHKKRARLDSIDKNHTTIVNRKIGNPLFFTDLLRAQGESIPKKVGSYQILTV